MQPSPAGRTHPISAGEWCAVGGIAGLALALTLAPAILEAQLGPSDRVHIGTYWFWRDFGQYLAAMREGAEVPSWLIHDHYSAEPHDPVFMYPLYVGIGKLSTAIGVPWMGLYRVIELATRVLIPVSLYVFVATFIEPVRLRPLALVLALFGGGVGFWTALTAIALGQGDLAGLGFRPLNPYLEAMTFGSLFAAPHLGLGLAATLLGVAVYCRAMAGSRWSVLGVAVSAAILSLVNAFNLPPLLLAMGIFAVGCLSGGRGLAARAVAATAAGCVAAAPAMVYSFLTFNFAPFWSQTYGAQNLLPSPAPWALLIDYGLVLILALAGAWSLVRSSTMSQRFLLLWVGVMLLAMYVPVPYQRRFTFGLQPALAVLAALGWPAWQAWILRVTRRWKPAVGPPSTLARRLAVYPLLLFGFADVLLAYAGVSLSAATNSPLPIYSIDRGSYAVGEWLGEHSTSEDVVLASFATGNVFGGMLPGRVVAGYEVATLRASEKQATIEAIYRGELSVLDLRAFVAANRVSYVFVGPEERRLGSYDPGAALGWAVALWAGDVVLYRR